MLTVINGLAVAPTQRRVLIVQAKEKDEDEMQKGENFIIIHPLIY